ncbi:hypothetical protein [Marinicella meishanensis]|uniref:hypothetical protein n=1 Tax=Marinicella meishanensis TaxID=2873263 RepID=UPI001CC0C3A2|nr:hypothetical protein [Marinicella sp. NBU2979]
MMHARPKKPNRHWLLVTALLLLAGPLWAQHNKPAGYQAKYQILRGGKPTAQQVTELTISNNRYTLKDHTEGTHGLASMTGFERTESTQFTLQGLAILTIEHRMKQTVAFSKKAYQFRAEPGSTTIRGQHKKKPFQVTAEVRPVSAHMMPWWLGHQVCNGLLPKAVTVLKSKQLRTYHFQIVEEADGLVRMDRIYPAGTDKSTSTWLDTKQHCLPVKTRHREGDDPVIETVLQSHQFH